LISSGPESENWRYESGKSKEYSLAKARQKQVKKGGGPLALTFSCKLIILNHLKDVELRVKWC
jgi:hypothetical protein